MYSCFFFHSAPGPVSDVQAFNVQQTTATIKWREIPKNERHGFITNYTIFYKDDKGLESCKFKLCPC